MADLETVSLAHLPDSLEVHIALYRDLKNAPFLHQQLLKGNSDFEYAFIDASIISSSFSTFGITPKTTSLLAVKISTNPSITHSSVSSHLSSCIEGTSIPFRDSNIRTLTDLDKVKKIYKLAGAAKSTSGKSTTKGMADKVNQELDKDDEGQWQELEAIILGSMALKGAT
ncbi:MAG: hypothetical protein Q9167_002292 [Letrouitia subvulpina]